MAMNQWLLQASGNKVKHLLISILCLTLVACGKPEVKSDVGLKTGEYKITEYSIESDFRGDSNLLEQQLEFDTFKHSLERKMPTMLAEHVPLQGRNVSMTIKVKLINLSINGVRAILVSDSVQVWTEIILSDPQTNQTLGTVPVRTISKTSGGILGAMLDTGLSAQEQDKRIEELTDQYTQDLISTLYPKSE